MCRKKGRFKDLVENSKFDWTSEIHRDLLRYISNTHMAVTETRLGGASGVSALPPRHLSLPLPSATSYYIIGIHLVVLLQGYADDSM